MYSTQRLRVTEAAGKEQRNRDMLEELLRIMQKARTRGLRGLKSVLQTFTFDGTMMMITFRYHCFGVVRHYRYEFVRTDGGALRREPLTADSGRPKHSTLSTDSSALTIP